MKNEFKNRLYIVYYLTDFICILYKIQNFIYKLISFKTLFDFYYKNTKKNGKFINNVNTID